MSGRAEYLAALSAAPAVSLEDSGLPAGEYCLPALWAIHDQLRRAHGGRLLDGIHEETAAAMDQDGFGPWRD